MIVDDKRLSEIEAWANAATTEPTCSGCGANVLRPKCMFELGGDCPRHETREEFLSTRRGFEIAALTDVPALCKSLREARKERDEARNALMVSEQYRRSYEAGKHALYGMGGEITEAAARHLPCGEGPLNRYVRKIEREHSPKLVAERTALVKELEKVSKERDPSRPPGGRDGSH